MHWVFNFLSLWFIDAILIYIYHHQHLTRCLLAILVLYDHSDKRDTKIANKHRLNVDDDIYINMASMNKIDKRMKIQGMMNGLIYWLSEKLVFVMIYQCNYCCVLLFVRRQHNVKKIFFVRESTLFTIQMTVVLLLERNPKNTHH